MTRNSNNVHSSVVSEPLAAYRAACVAVGGGVRHVLLVSDHEPLVHAGARGYASARTYNTLLVALERDFPGVRFSFAFVPGARNRADPWSRGLCGWTSDTGAFDDPSVAVGLELPRVSADDVRVRALLQKGWNREGMRAGF
jgi:hypothetical protein